MLGVMSMPGVGVLVYACESYSILPILLRPFHQAMRVVVDITAQQQTNHQGDIERAGYAERYGKKFSLRGGPGNTSP